jgi:hypothetical protein
MCTDVSLDLYDSTAADTYRDPIGGASGAANSPTDPTEVPSNTASGVPSATITGDTAAPVDPDSDADYCPDEDVGPSPAA